MSEENKMSVWGEKTRGRAVSGGRCFEEIFHSEEKMKT